MGAKRGEVRRGGIRRASRRLPTRERSLRRQNEASDALAKAFDAGSKLSETEKWPSYADWRLPGRGGSFVLASEASFWRRKGSFWRRKGSPARRKLRSRVEEVHFRVGSFPEGFEASRNP